MGDNNIDEDVDRTLLRESRKIRRKQKKEEKQNKKEKEREMKTLELKFGPRDSRVTIVSKEFASSLVNETKTKNSPALQIKEDDFPVLGQLLQSKGNKNTTDVSPEIKQNTDESTKRIKSKITINIQDIISKPEKPERVVKDKSNQVKQYSGNILDSSQPERKRGKHREVPKRKVPTKLKATIFKENLLENAQKIEYTGLHSPLFETYCDNCVTEELNTATTTFFKEIVNFQEKLFKRDPVKGVSKRRYVVGFHEVKKFLKVGKIQLIIIAPNIKITVENGVLDNTISDIKMLANLYDTPYIFALSRRIMGRLFLKTIPISCVGILDRSGAEESFKNVLELLPITRELYKNSQPVATNKDEVGELNDKLLEVLKQ